MGQYYRNTFLKKNWKTAKQPVKASLRPYDFVNGALNGFIKPCGMQEIEHHCYLGRKVEVGRRVRIKFEKEV